MSIVKGVDKAMADKANVRSIYLPDEYWEQLADLTTNDNSQSKLIRTALEKVYNLKRATKQTQPEQVAV